MLTGKIEIGGELQTIHVKTAPEISYQIPGVFTKDEVVEFVNKFYKKMSIGFSVHAENHIGMYTVFVDTDDKDYRNESEVQDYLMNILIDNFLGGK